MDRDRNSDGFRWLSADEQRAWRAYLRATEALLAHLDRESQRRAGLSLADYEILVRLSEAPGRRLRMSDLSDETQFSRSRLSHATNRLAALGWIEREECPTDRRGTFAVLTDAGFAALAAAAPGHVDVVRRLVFDALGPDDVEGFEQCCTRIADAVEAACTRIHSRSGPPQA
ncbi:MAG: MarR family winged helix-turn-helix transcriptional regulator [Acidimicrobiia bacterium]